MINSARGFHGGIMGAVMHLATVLLIELRCLNGIQWSTLGFSVRCLSSAVLDDKLTVQVSACLSVKYFLFHFFSLHATEKNFFHFLSLLKTIFFPLFSVPKSIFFPFQKVFFFPL